MGINLKLVIGKMAKFRKMGQFLYRKWENGKVLENGTISTEKMRKWWNFGHSSRKRGTLTLYGLDCKLELMHYQFDVEHEPMRSWRVIRLRVGRAQMWGSTVHYSNIHSLLQSALLYYTFITAECITLLYIHYCRVHYSTIHPLL